MNPGTTGPTEAAAVGPATRSSGPGGIHRGWWAALAVLLIAVIAIGAMLLVDGEQREEFTPRSIAELVTEPSQHIGERVAVTGRVDELLTDRALAIGSDLAEDDLLVLINTDATIRGYAYPRTAVIPVPAGEFYEVGDVVQFIGEVRDFDRDALAEELDLVLNDELFATWDGRPVVIMDQLDVATLGTLEPPVTPAPSPS